MEEQLQGTDMNNLESEDASLHPLDDATPVAPAPIEPKSSRRKWLWVALAILILLALIGLSVFLVKHSKSTQKTTTTVTINTQTLSPGTLAKLEQQTAGNNTVNEQLTINPNSLFKNNLTVQGNGSFAKNLQVGGNLGVSGNANIGGNLSVTGLISGGSMSVSSLTLKTLQLNGDLTFSGHIVPRSSTPTIKTNNAARNGTVQIDGTDTAGTVTITTGSGAQIAGEMAVITFHTAFGTTPKVQLTPVNAAGASLQYFVTQSPTFFSVETANVPAAGTAYTFNYFVTQ